MKAKEATDKLGGRYIRIDCPGCKEPHMMPVNGPNAWGFNKNFEAPTLTPSIKVSTTGIKEGTEFVKCHSFVTDGRIQFLTDSAHELAGQTVDLPEIEKEGWDI